MKKFLKLTLIVSLIIGSVILIKSCESNKLEYYRPRTLSDQMQVMVKEVAVIDHFDNEWITVMPEINNVLLISVLEVYNTTGRDIEMSPYFDQKVSYSDTVYDSKIFSVYDGPIKNKRKRYIYFISELPVDIIKRGKIRGVKVDFVYDGEQVEFGGKINNAFGYQDLISNTYTKVSQYQKDFDKYWKNDMAGFRSVIEERSKNKNYKYIHDLINTIQRDYRSKIEILNINLEQMQELSLITPIYPDANIKMIKETIFLKNRLEAIVNTENTSSTAQGLQEFLEKCAKNLKKAEELNEEALKDISQQLKEEKFNL